MNILEQNFPFASPQLVFQAGFEDRGNSPSLDGFLNEGSRGQNCSLNVSLFWERGRKGRTKTNAFIPVLLSVFFWISCFVSQVEAGPSPSNVVRGQVDVHKRGEDTTEIQVSDNSIIEYKNFDIQSGTTVRFSQPDQNSRVLNRVTGGEISHINGTLSANGQVYLTNPSGVMIGESGRVNTGNFVAAAASMSNKNFLNHKDQFSGTKGVVENHGRIVSKGVHLIGKQVQNFGKIYAPEGTITMSAGDTVTLKKSPDEDVYPMIKREKNRDTQGVNNQSGAAVQNQGTVRARAGSVRMGAGDRFAVAIQHSGRLWAREIRLRAKGETRTTVSGTVRATRIRPTATGNDSIQMDWDEPGRIGGDIEIYGQEIVMHDLEINARGLEEGGSVKIGGDRYGSGTFNTAEHVLVDGDSVLDVSATEQGDGGEVIVWSERSTHLQGNIFARGGPDGGDGGFVEVSGKQYLDTSITNVDVSASAGKDGRALFDPDSIVIQGGSADGDDQDGASSELNQDSSICCEDERISFGDSPGVFTVYESELEGTTSGNIVLEARDTITASGSFSSDGSTGNPDIILSPDISITMRTRNGSDDTDGKIDLTTSMEDTTLTLETQGTGSMTFVGSSLGDKRGDVIVGPLRSDTGTISLNSNNGAVELYGDIMTDGGNVRSSSTMVMNRSITVNTEVGGDSAAGNVDFSSAVLTTKTSDVGEAGTFNSAADGTWKTIHFTQHYSSPVVVATPNTFSGEASLITEVKNVTSTSAEVRVVESDGNATSGSDGIDPSHPSETVGYFVFDAEKRAQVEGFDAGKVTAGDSFDAGGQVTVSFQEGFSDPPVVLTTVQSDNGINPIEGKVTSVNSDQFKGGIGVQNSNNGTLSSHVDETLGWIALDPDHLVWNTMDAGKINTSSSNWVNASFSPADSFSSPPAVLAETLTKNGGQNLMSDEVRNVNTGGADVRFDELDSPDSSDGHNTETVGWFAVDQTIYKTPGSMIIDARGTTNGKVELGSVDNSGGNFPSKITVKNGGEDVLLHGDIQLDGGQFRVRGTSDLVVSNSLMIDTEIGEDEPASALNFRSNTISADKDGVSLTMNTKGGTDANITLGSVSDSGGKYLNEMTLSPGGRSVILTEDITLNANGSPSYFTVTGGTTKIEQNVKVDIEAGNDARSRSIDLADTTVTSTTFFEHGESGIFESPADGSWTTIHFSEDYSSPVVVATANTFSGDPTLVTEVKNVYSGSADIRVVESDGNATSTSDGIDTSHPPEKVSYFVFDAAESGSVSGMEGGTFSIGDNFESTTKTVNLNESFSSNALVLGTVQTDHGINPIEFRLTNTDNSSFTAGIGVQNSNDDMLSGHVDETVGWVAIDPGNLPVELADADRFSMGDSNWNQVVLSPSEGFSKAPPIMAEIQNNNGGQNLISDEVRNVSPTRAEIRFDELDPKNSSDTHAGNQVGWLAWSENIASAPGQLTLDARGSTDGNVKLGTIDASTLRLQQLRVKGGSITQNGSLDVKNMELAGSGPVHLPNSGNEVDTIAANITGPGHNIHYTDTNKIKIGSVGGSSGIRTTGPDGDVKLTASGAIKDSNTSRISGTLRMNTGGTHRITLDENGNDFHAVTIDSAGDVTLEDTNSIRLGTLDVSGKLKVVSDGDNDASNDISIYGNIQAGHDVLLRGKGGNEQIDLAADVDVIAGSPLTMETGIEQVILSGSAESTNVVRNSGDGSVSLPDVTTANNESVNFVVRSGSNITSGEIDLRAGRFIGELDVNDNEKANATIGGDLYASSVTREVNADTSPVDQWEVKESVIFPDRLVNPARQNPWIRQEAHRENPLTWETEVVKLVEQVHPDPTIIDRVSTTKRYPDLPRYEEKKEERNPQVQSGIRKENLQCTSVQKEQTVIENILKGLAVKKRKQKSKEGNSDKNNQRKRKVLTLKYLDSQENTFKRMKFPVSEDLEDSKELEKFQRQYRKMFPEVRPGELSKPLIQSVREKRKKVRNYLHEMIQAFRKKTPGQMTIHWMKSVLELSPDRQTAQILRQMDEVMQQLEELDLRDKQEREVAKFVLKPYRPKNSSYRDIQLLFR